MTVSDLGDLPPEPDRGARAALTALLRRPRYEVLALPGTADQVAEHVPTNVPVTVTAGVRRGLGATVELAEELARRGYWAVPHLAARLVRDRSHLEDLVVRLDDAGVGEIFVVGGDADPPVGDFAEAQQILEALPGRRCLGVAAYPEGHPRIDDAELDRSLLAKQPGCSYAVTQMCFDAQAVADWVRHARGIGFDRPIHVGVPGPVEPLRLAKVATRIGVGQSLRYARKQRGGARMLQRGGYRPDDLLLALAGTAAIGGLHVYTLGDVAATEQWRTETLERLADG